MAKAMVNCTFLGGGFVKPQNSVNRKLNQSSNGGDPLIIRQTRLREFLAAQKLTAAIFTDVPSLRYLTNFSGTDSALVVVIDHLYLITDSRYQEEAEKIRTISELKLSVIIHSRGIGDTAISLLNRRRIKKIGVAAANFSFALAQRLGAAGLKTIALAADWNNFRQQKTAAEIAAIKQAIAIAEKSFREMRSTLRQGITELDVKAELEYRAAKNGAEAMAFPTIVAAGANASLPHASAGKRKIVSSEPLLIDFGTVVNGYVSDLTRTVFIGSMPNIWRFRYRALLAAQAAGIVAIRAGVSGKIPDTAARKILAQQQHLDKFFIHGLGHGIGLEVHETPRLSAKAHGVLPENAVVTVEPGVYFPDEGGIRIEDDILITAVGAEVLSWLEKDIAASII